MSRFPDPVENEITGPLDDLDQAHFLLVALADAESDEQGVSYSLKAIAHVLLWQATQQREWQRQQIAAARAAEAWRAAQPPPPPPPSMPPLYQGF